jgi:hypothetical protein
VQATVLVGEAFVDELDLQALGFEGVVPEAMSLHVLAYNLKRMIAILGARPLIQAMRAA